MDCCLWEEIFKTKMKAFLSNLQADEHKLKKHTVTKDQNIQGTNCQSDHIMSSDLLLLTMLQGIPGLFK